MRSEILCLVWREYLVGINTPPTLLSLITPPMAVTLSLSLGLEVLWSWTVMLSQIICE